MSEISFAGVLGRRRFRYAKKDGYTISADADFVICGEIHANQKKLCHQTLLILLKIIRMLCRY